MRKLAIALMLLLTVGSTAWAAVPDRTPTPIQLVNATLTGSTADLEAALAEPSSLTYKILVVDQNPADRTAYLDQVLTEWGWPTANEMLIVLFPQANYDLRFALGSAFKLNYISVDEVLALARAEYFPRKQKGDAAGGLASLVRAINRRMSPSGISEQQARFEGMRQVVAKLQLQDAKGLLELLDPAGLLVAPYAVGAPDNRLSQADSAQVLDALCKEARLEIIGYDLTAPNRVQVVVSGLQAGLEVPASGTPGNRIKTTDTVILTVINQNGAWRLSSVTMDPQDLLPKRIDAGDFTKPFAWVTIEPATESASWGFGSDPGSEANTTSQESTQSLTEAERLLGQGVQLPAWLEGSQMQISQVYSRDYRPLSASLMSLNPAFHASFSPVGRHVGSVKIDANWSVATESLVINGRPALLLSLDEKREGGWRHRYLLIEDGNWLYYLEDGLGDSATLIARAQEI